MDGSHCRLKMFFTGYLQNLGKSSAPARAPYLYPVGNKKPALGGLL